MRTDSVEAVGIGEAGSLWVKPAAATIPLIYREAMEVHWDPTRLRLYSPKPRKWSCRRPARAERHFLGAAFRAPWRDLPERYAPRITCYNRFVRWRKAGVWDRLMDAIRAAHDSELQMIDNNSIRAHQQAATAKRGSRSLS